MEVWEYNHWVGYMMTEQEQHESEMRKAKHR